MITVEITIREGGKILHRRQAPAVHSIVWESPAPIIDEETKTMVYGYYYEAKWGDLDHSSKTA